MATGTRTRGAKSTRAKAKPAPAPEPEELEDDAELEADDELDTEAGDDLEELDADEVEEKAPAKKKKGGAAQEVTFGVQDIVAHLAKKHPDHKVNARGLRTLIRKMARDGSSRVQREIVAGNRTRYDWPNGLKDPEVKAIIAAYEGGELEADKKEKLEALKQRKAQQDKAAGKVKGKKTKAAPKKVAAPVVEEDDDEDLELDEDE